MKTFFTTLLLLTVIALSSAFADDAPKDAGLPKVLIIGDSISIGYTPHVVLVLKDKAVALPIMPLSIKLMWLKWLKFQ